MAVQPAPSDHQAPNRGGCGFLKSRGILLTGQLAPRLAGIFLLPSPPRGQREGVLESYAPIFLPFTDQFT